MKNFVLVSIVVILLAAILFAVRIITLENKISPATQSEEVDLEQNKTPDFTKEAIENNSLINESVLLIQDNDLEAARAKLQEAVDTETDPNIKSIADISLADTYFRDNQPDLGADNMMRVAMDTSYPSSTRAFALTTILQQYNGTKNIELLKVFGDVTSGDISTLIENAHKQVVTFHPMGLSVAYLAGLEMSRDATKAEAIYDEAIFKINNDIARQNQGQGSNYIVPNIMMAKASLMIKAEKLGYEDSENIILTYKEAIVTAKEKLQTITAQFAILSYMNYLGGDIEANQKFIDEALTILKNESLTTMVKNHLNREAFLKERSGIDAIIKSNQDYLDFFSQYVPISN